MSIAYEMFSRCAPEERNVSLMLGNSTTETEFFRKNSVSLCALHFLFV